MKSPSHFVLRRRGSALIAVILLAGMMALLTASLLKYSGTEQRGNERNRLILRARNMAENISLYAAEQLTTKLYRLRSATPMAFMTGSNAIDLPPPEVLTTTYTSTSGMEVRAGLTSTTGLTYINPTDPANANNPNIGLSVSTSIVPIISQATATHSAIGSVVAYNQHDLEVAMIPLFQFGIFYNMDLEFFPGQDMSIYGPVHTNGRLLARGEVGGSAVLTFASRVTAAQGLYADGQLKVAYRNRSGGNTSGAGGTGAVNYTSVAGTQTNLKNSSGVWRDHKWGGTNETATTLNQFKTFATSTYSGNVRTNVHGVTTLELPSIGTYKETNDPNTSEDDRNNGRQIIEPANPQKYESGAWVDTTDSAGIRESKISRKVGLYIIVNPDDDATPRTGRLPNGTTVPMLPRSYRCWLNTVNSDGTHSLHEVVLPGQPSYGFYDVAGTPTDYSDDVMYQNNLPNRFTDQTAIGSNQVLRIPFSGRAADQPIIAGLTPASPTPVPPGATFVTNTSVTTGYSPGAAAPTLTSFGDAYFYDLRRATNNSGYPYNRSAKPYTPRPIAKIDLDLVRFRLTVERTLNGADTSSAIYDPSPPTATNWSRSIFNASGNPSTMKLGLKLGSATDYTVFPTEATHDYDADPFRMYYAPATTSDPIVAVPSANLVNSSGSCPWYDGVTIYVHSVEAEKRGDGADADTEVDRIDSGVRLWHGRGPVISLTNTNMTGFTFATNDAAYIVGHFNADGKNLNSTVSSTSFSGRYPDSANENLACVMADAITILSQPTFSSTGYVQTAGWNDALSAHRVVDSSWSSSWQTSNPSSSNSYEGIAYVSGTTGKRAAVMPNLSTPAGSGTQHVEKMTAVNTEISTALLMGMVPSNHNPSGLTDGPPSSVANQQYSGGAHNFPRLIEAWNGIGLYIRGSMVALFESRVAMEPWNLRVYNAPNRYWGLHESLSQANHDLPLEPVVLNARRMRFRELTAADYAAKKIEIEALPH